MGNIMTCCIPKLLQVFCSKESCLTPAANDDDKTHPVFAESAGFDDFEKKPPPSDNKADLDGIPEDRDQGGVAINHYVGF